MATIKYTARKAFKYNGSQVKAGQEIEPVGGKWDDKIFNEQSGFVTVERVEAKPARRRSGGTKNAGTTNKS